MPAWKALGGRGRSHGRGKGGQAGRGVRPAKDTTQYRLQCFGSWAASPVQQLSWCKESSCKSCTFCNKFNKAVLSDAYFHIPIHRRSRQFLRFHFQDQTYQFRALPFGPSIAPMEFTCVVKEVKLLRLGYKDSPVPRLLLDSSPHQRVLPSGPSIPPHPLPGPSIHWIVFSYHLLGKMY